MIRRALCLAVVLTALAALAGCKGEPDDTPWCSAAPRPAAKEPTASRVPTWFADIKPIAAAKCNRCHVTGGIGPFPLVEVPSWTDRAPLIRQAIERFSETMATGKVLRRELREREVGNR